MQITADSSAFLAVVLNESTKPRILECTVGAELRSPPSLEWEVGNALSAMLRRDRIDRHQASAALRAFEQIPVQLSRVSLEASLTIAADHGIYAYDAYVLECCLRYATPLLSLDTHQCHIARVLGIDVLEVT